MAVVPDNLKYAATHEWVAMDGDIATVGITDHAQEALGEIVYLDLKGSGTHVGHNDKFGEIESVKAVSELYAPVSGEIVELNTEVRDDQSLINSSPFERGWLIKIRIANSEELSQLLSAEDYSNLEH